MQDVKLADISGTKRQYQKAAIDELETKSKIKKYQRLVQGHQ
jgi:hypothetical protein